MSTFQSLLLTSCAVFVLTASISAQSRTPSGPPPVRSFSSSAKSPPANRPPTTSGVRNPQRYATKHLEFAIPFSVAAKDQVIVEVYLHVSSDRGQRWSQYARSDLRQNEFRFSAPEDGEYWFAVQTLNRNGQRVPAKIALPELVVVVDTAPPVIEARASTDAAGRIAVDWRARDEHLSTDSFTIRFRPSGSDDPTAWTNVPVKVTKALSGPLFNDSYAFWPESNALNLDLEVSIRDQAGNQATTLASVQRMQTTPNFNLLPGAGNSPSTADATNVAGKWSPATQQKNNLASATSGQNAGRSFGSTALPHADGSHSSGAAPSTADDRQQLAAHNSAAANSGAAKPTPVEWRSARHSDSGKQLARGSTQNALVREQTIQPLPPSAEETTPLPDRMKQHDQLADRNLPPQTTRHSPPALLASDRFSRPDDVEPHSVLSQPAETAELQTQAISVRSKRFRLNYQVEAIDPAGVKEVSVWVTRDAGKTWNRLGTNTDPQSPYPVEVDSSGLYGFRLVVTGHSGVKGRLPQPGDSADKWIRVDVDPPFAKITSAPQGTDENAGKLVINWEARDDQLALRPIELSYSTRPEGPWTTIEKGLRNTGSYVWAVRPDGPTRVYLRLTVRDEAGNETTDQTGYAVDISNLYPRGRIQSVEPIGD